MHKTMFLVVTGLAVAGLTLGGCSNEPQRGSAASSDSTAESQQVVQTEQREAYRDMDVSQIQVGDFSSIVGTWTNSQGDTLEVDSSLMTWSAYGSPFATVKQDTFTSIRVPEGTYVGGIVDSAEVPLEMQWVTDPTDGSQGTGPSIGSMLVFYPSGFSAIDPYNHVVLPSDQSKDRILALPDAGIGRLWPPEPSSYIMTRVGDPGHAEAGESSAAQPPKSVESDMGCTPPVPDAYPCAGGPIPPEARPITTVGNNNTATLKTPTGNIGCEITLGSTNANVSCGAESWWHTSNPVLRPDFGWASAGFSESGPAVINRRDDAPSWDGGNPGTPAGESVPYGQVVYHGPFVFASSEAGLTYWNSETGYGAFINADDFRPFGG